jgi:hypothetical protein
MLPDAIEGLDGYVRLFYSCSRRNFCHALVVPLSNYFFMLESVPCGSMLLLQLESHVEFCYGDVLSYSDILFDWALSLLP